MNTVLQACKPPHCALIALLPVGIFHADAEGHYLWVNDRWCEMAGLPLAQIQGNGWVQALHPDDKGRVFAEWYRAVQENLPFQTEYRFQRPDGKITWVLAQAVAEKNETDTVKGYVGTITDITDVYDELRLRKQSEESLRSTQKFFRELLDYIPAPVYITTAEEQRYRLVNRAWEKLVGTCREKVLGHSFDEVFPPAVAKQFNAMNQQVIDMGSPVVTEECVDLVDGRHYFHSVKFPMHDASGRIEAVAGISLDITEGKQAEEALRQSEERFRHMAENIREVFWMADLELTQMFYVSPAYEEIWGRTCASLYAQPRSFIEAIYPDDRERVLAVLEQNRQNEFSQEYRIVQPDGSVRWIWEHAFPVRNNAGQLYCLVGVSQDITDRRQAEDALREQKEWYRRILETASEGIWTLDAENKTVFANRKIAQMLGYTVDEMLGMSLFAFMDEEGKAIAQINLERRHHGIEEQHDFKFRRKDGSVMWAIVSATPLFDAAGQYAGAFGMITDITDRKRAEEALRQQVLREQLIARISQRIHQSLNLEEILNTTVAEVRQFLVCDRVIIYRLQSDGNGVVVVESVGSDWKPISGTIIEDRYFAKHYFQLYRQGRVHVVEDIYTAGLTPCHVDLLTQFQVKANLVVPIVQEEQLWGLLVAQQCSGTRQWQPLEVDLLKALATQAAIAIQKSELYEQAQVEIGQRQQAEATLRQQFFKERLMVEIAQRIRQSLNLEDILNTTVAEVRQFLGTDRVLIYRIWSNGTGSAVTEAVVPGWPAVLGRTFPEEVFPHECHQWYCQGRILNIADIDKAEVLPCLAEFVHQFAVKAKLVVPILQKETLWGLLIAHHCRAPRQWQPLEIDLLKSLATQLAIAIQQSELYKRTQYQALREQALNRVIQTIRNSLDLTTIFSTATYEIAQLVQADRADILHYLPERKVWLNVANYNQSSDLPNALGEEIPDRGNELTAQLKRLNIVRINDANTCSDEINRGIARTSPGAWLLVPLHYGSRVWGALSLVRNRAPSAWTDSEVTLTCAVADQLAIALQQAELYQQSRAATANALQQAEQLEQALQELQRTQSQLVQSEKMSSLGQLVAGVAHEINNPVSFIYANLTYASDYTQDLLGLIELYQEQYPKPTPNIQSEIEAIELDFLIEDLPKLLSSMKVGAERICEIVAALRNFSRLAEAEIKAVDIHEGIDSTLTILQNRLKAQGKHPEIQVMKEYGKLPEVECYAGQLNQVFMNIISNAIDAIDEQNQGRTPEEIAATPSFIRIRTELLSDRYAVIRIADNGLGITEQIKDRIFDPFFTTKPVGAGTGLGLSISYQIVVEKHGGQLHCLSEPSAGTEFVIQIPLWQNLPETSS
ncbi:MAG TPA: PAS domain S-box protein [Chroococcales cyanobacterium]